MATRPLDDELEKRKRRNLLRQEQGQRSIFPTAAIPAPTGPEQTKIDQLDPNRTRSVQRQVAEGADPTQLYRSGQLTAQQLRDLGGQQMTREEAGRRQEAFLNVGKEEILRERGEAQVEVARDRHFEDMERGAEIKGDAEVDAFQRMQEIKAELNRTYSGEEIRKQHNDGMAAIDAAFDAGKYTEDEAKELRKQQEDKTSDLMSRSASRLEKEEDRNLTSQDTYEKRLFYKPGEDQNTGEPIGWLDNNGNPNFFDTKGEKRDPDAEAEQKRKDQRIKEIRTYARNLIGQVNPRTNSEYTLEEAVEFAVNEAEAIDAALGRGGDAVPDPVVDPAIPKPGAGRPASMAAEEFLGVIGGANLTQRQMDEATALSSENKRNAAKGDVVAESGTTAKLKRFAQAATPGDKGFRDQTVQFMQRGDVDAKTKTGVEALIDRMEKSKHSTKTSNLMWQIKKVMDKYDVKGAE